MKDADRLLFIQYASGARDPVACMNDQPFHTITSTLSDPHGTRNIIDDKNRDHPGVSWAVMVHPLVVGAITQPPINHRWRGSTVEADTYN